MGLDWFFPICVVQDVRAGALRNFFSGPVGLRNTGLKEVKCNFIKEPIRAL